jgi:hypothetical protein
MAKTQGTRFCRRNIWSKGANTVMSESTYDSTSTTPFKKDSAPWIDFIYSLFNNAASISDHAVLKGRISE